MIWFDVTKSQTARHKSGLIRLGGRLREELGGEAAAAAWTEVRDRAAPDDWWVTTELFSEMERPGIGEFIRSGRCRTAAIFADAIPVKHPQITWPRSVARHPGYMKLLAAFTQVWAISEASRGELTGYWRWLGLERTPPVGTLPLGADFNGAARVTERRQSAGVGPPGLLCVGILEPRKNQLFLLEVCEALWASGLAFDLHIAGRVNPYFGAPIVARIKLLKKKFSGLHYHKAAADAELARLYATARATVFATMAEGCGLPLLESLWRGVPCVGSDLPVLRENADGGGCLMVPVNDRAAWGEALRAIVTDDGLHARLTAEAVARPLPTWAEAARELRTGLTA
jgi:glycosyltransferase involved in cell wall biosynthesis